MTLTDDMIVRICERIAKGEFCATSEKDCDLIDRIIKEANTDIQMRATLQIISSIQQVIHVNHHNMIECIRAGWKLREEMQGVEELERMIR